MQRIICGVWVMGLDKSKGKCMVLLDQIKAYKTLLTGSYYNLFNGKMTCNLSGVSYDGRQKFLAAVEEGTPIKLVRDRRNEHDFYAISVNALIEGEWEDIGFLPSKVNKKIANAIDSGVSIGAKVWRKTGGKDGFYRGLSITVEREED